MNNLKKFCGIIRHPKRVLVLYNKLGNRKRCNICGNTFSNFIPYKTGEIIGVAGEFKMVGSVNKNFGCPYCGAHDRTRHIFMFFDKLCLWKYFEDSSILHCSPEKQIYEKIKDLTYQKYVVSDIEINEYNFAKEIVRIDFTKINYPDESFDIIIANHVLEHIPKFEEAIKEIYRVLKTGGFAILQTPYSELLKNTFQDEGINTDNLRLKFYGENDHYRIFVIGK